MGHTACGFDYLSLFNGPIEEPKRITVIRVVDTKTGSKSKWDQISKNVG